MAVVRTVPNPAEVATLIVGGFQFNDWESVWIQHRWTDDSALFKFTAAERDPNPDRWATLRFIPGDECAIYLGKQLAVAGVILTRQVAYDAFQHGVMLMGKGVTWYAARGSIIDKDSKFDDMTFEEVARKVIAPFGVGVQVIGKLDEQPFARLRNEPGETVWTFLERIARPKKIVLGSDHLGNFLLIGDHSYSNSADLVEGYNILKCQCVIDVQNKRSDFFFRGQTAASDSQYGQAAAEQEARVTGTAKRYSPLLGVAEQPVWNVSELQKRAVAERQWNEGTEVSATITVQGWQMPNSFLWAAGAQYFVRSPMALLNQALKAQTVTFTQDSSQGTQTVLDLVAPWLLNGSSDFNLANPNVLPGTNAPSDSGPLLPMASPEQAPPLLPERID
jgi:prophage tail gpP-like protein